jgi:hypothetical protein
MIAETPSHHLGQAHQHRVQRRRVGGVHGKCMLVADRLWPALADLLIEPATRIFAA